MNQQGKKRLPASPEEWLAHAQSDLKLSQLGKDNPEILHEQICFHSQQSVEKALKAVLLFSKIDFPLTHDLEELSYILEGAGIHLPQDILDVGILTPYAVEARYPGYWGELTGQDVDEAITLSERVLKWAAAYITKETESE